MIPISIFDVGDFAFRSDSVCVPYISSSPGLITRTKYSILIVQKWYLSSFKVTPTSSKKVIIS